MGAVDLLRPVTHRVVSVYLRRRFPGEPIIVGGPPRSGTTLLLSILGSHPHVYAIDYETTAFHPSFRPEKLFSAVFFENESRRRRRIPISKRRLAEKTPGNIRHYDRINEFFDGHVKVVNIFRDPRDILTSRHPLRPDEYWVSLGRWMEDVRRGLHASRNPNVLTIRYEDLVADPERSIRDVCRFIDEIFSPTMLEYHVHTNVKRNLAWEGSATAIHATSVRKWTRPEHRARIAEFLANDEAVELSERTGYPVREGGSASTLQRI